jgi:hypothetical protein
MDIEDVLHIAETAGKSVIIVVCDNVQVTVYDNTVAGVGNMSKVTVDKVENRDAKIE